MEVARDPLEQLCRSCGVSESHPETSAVASGIGPAGEHLAGRDASRPARALSDVRCMMNTWLGSTPFVASATNRPRR